MYLASELVARGHSVSMVSPWMSDVVEDGLRANGIVPMNLRAKLVVKNLGSSLLWLEAWAREAFLKLNSRHIDNRSCILNFSQVISVPSLVWYLQGPPSVALKDMAKELSVGFRVAYDVSKKFIEYADERLVSRMGGVSRFIVANSKFCASMYLRFGVTSSCLIYPPIDCQIFRPSTARPSSDYVLTYFGKETKFSVVKKIADVGVKIKAFGSKNPFIKRDLMNHPNVEFLGRVSTSELVRLYSNALFTLFPFMHEPFGYVPLESLACGTPVLTYDLQGPSEYVANESTGWLLNSDGGLVQRAGELLKDGYSPAMRTKCVETASKFDRNFYAENWLKILSLVGKL
jgi:glycosyltransferase involved in cell wall biosynthesis